LAVAGVPDDVTPPEKMFEAMFARRCSDKQQVE
jgi:hypothetical protein